MIRSMAGARANSVVSVLFCLIFVAASGSVTATSHGSGEFSSIQDLIPSILVVPDGYHVQQVLFGTGVQFYDYNGTAWVNSNVSADLYNFKGIKVGHHFFLSEQDSNGGQPTWESFGTHRIPSTRVTAKREAGVSQQDSIDWLLLEATSNSGKTFFGLTRFVQRLYTLHGLPPSVDFPAKKGDVFESNYSAQYIFYAKDR